MDRKTILVVIICVLLLTLFNGVIVPKLYPPIPLPPGATNTVSAVQGTNATVASAPPVLSTAPDNSIGSAIQPTINTNVSEELLVVTHDKARYTFSSYGGGLKLVELLEYPEEIPQRKGEKVSTNHVALNSFSPAPTLAVIGDPAIQEDGIFTLTRTEMGVRAEKALSNGLVWTKDFVLETNSYLVSATARLENRSTQPVTLSAQEWVVGTATPMNARDDGTTVGVMWYDGRKAHDLGPLNVFATRGFGCVPKTPPRTHRTATNHIAWVAAHNQFFALTVMPQEAAQELIVHRLDLPRYNGASGRYANTNIQPQGYEAVMVYPGTTLNPGAARELKFFIFAGPKEYRTLAQFAARFRNELDVLMGFGWASFFAKALLLSMNWLHATFGLGYGLTIVTITVLIKLLFWPLTAASTRSMKRMAALAPQMKALQEKYKDDPVKANRKMMEFYKEQKVNPLGGCLPMLVQMPVFIGFFVMISKAIELRGASFLWIADLSRPDTLFFIPGLGWIPIIGGFLGAIPGVGLPFNLLPLIMGATMLWQSHLTPTSPGMDPMQQKMMRYLPLIFLVFLYNYSAGMALYWTTNNLLTILQTKLTKTAPPAPAPAPAPALTKPLKKKK